MRFNFLLKNGYRVATVMIVLGFVLLCQPLSQTLFSVGFPILFIGVLLFMVLDHIPEKLTTNEEG